MPDDENGNNGGAQSAVLDALKSKELLVPAALSAAAAVVAAKAPDVVRQLTAKAEGEGEEQAERLGEKGAEGAKRALTGGDSGGGLKGMMAGAAAKALPGKGGGGGGGKKTRRLPIQRWTDVAVPVADAYEKWTSFDEYPKFMHRVLEVESEDENTVKWREKIWFSTREWEGEITERRKNDRIAWKTVNGTRHSGIVSFHPLGDNLTRVMVTIEFEPTGMLEKMASGMRFVKRAVQSDLARFKAYAEFDDAAELEYPSGGGGKQSDSGGGKRSDSGGSGDQDRERGREQREQHRRERRSSPAGSG
jgi:uncharacterized membrane protein